MWQQGHDVGKVAHEGSAKELWIARKLKRVVTPLWPFRLIQ